MKKIVNSIIALLILFGFTLPANANTTGQSYEMTTPSGQTAYVEILEDTANKKVFKVTAAGEPTAISELDKNTGEIKVFQGSETVAEVNLNNHIEQNPDLDNDYTSTSMPSSNTKTIQSVPPGPTYPPIEYNRERYENWTENYYHHIIYNSSTTPPKWRIGTTDDNRVTLNETSDNQDDLNSFKEAMNNLMSEKIKLSVDATFAIGDAYVAIFAAATITVAAAIIAALPIAGIFVDSLMNMYEYNDQCKQYYAQLT